MPRWNGPSDPRRLYRISPFVAQGHGEREVEVNSRPKRRPVRTETCDEDDTLRLAHLLKAIQRRRLWPLMRR